MRTRIAGLDGLRGLSCMGVVASHLAIPIFAGGWLGVDVFFVLSGFLITGLLLDELAETGRIRVLAFYARRMGRLYPALLVTVALTVTLAASGVPGARGGTRWDLMVALAYLEDFWRQTKHIGFLLGHTWSLAVEEQFYLVWPLVVLALSRRRWGLLVAAVCGAAASIALMFLQSGGGVLTDEVYYAFAPRIWEILAGCALAVILRRTEIEPKWGKALAWAGTIVLAEAVTSDLRVGVRGVAAVLAVTGTLVLVASVRTPSLPLRVLEWRALRWVGERSYGIYLYHYPIVVVTAQALPWRHSVKVALDLILIFAVAALSYRFVETPIREQVRSGLPRRTDRPAEIDLREGQPAGAALLLT